MEKYYEEIMKENEGNMKELWNIMREFIENMKDMWEIWRNYEEKWRKYEENFPLYMSRGTWKSRGTGERYAYADTIPEMAPSTEREGGSPAKNWNLPLLQHLSEVYS